MTVPSEDRVETTLAAIRADLERVGRASEGLVSPGAEGRPDNPLDDYIRQRVDELIRAWLRENLHQTVRDLLRGEIASQSAGPSSSSSE